MHLDPLTAFGLLSVGAMLAFYALEDRSHWFVLLFAGSCLTSAAYGFLQGAWPFGLVETIWSAIAVRRWRRRLTRPRLAKADSTPTRAGPTGALN